MEKLNIKFIILGVIIILIIFIYITFFYEVKKIDFEESNSDIIEKKMDVIGNDDKLVENKKSDEAKVFVEIKGAVNNPGVYEMNSNSRVIDVVNSAGGFRDDANTRYINLSRKVKDEMNIIIYTNEEINNSKESKIVVIEKECVCPEIKNDSCLDKNNDSNNSGLVSINTASLDELLTIPGIGESKAKSIIEYRENKLFEKIEDIMNVKGIGESLFNAVKEYITV